MAAEWEPRIAVTSGWRCSAAATFARSVPSSKSVNASTFAVPLVAAMIALAAMYPPAALYRAASTFSPELSW
jgi:hypothetical protein